MPHFSGTSSVQMLNLTYVGDFMGAHLDTLLGFDPGCLVGLACFYRPPRFHGSRFGSTVYFITLQGEFVAVDLPDFSLSDVSDGQVPSQPLLTLHFFPSC